MIWSRLVLLAETSPRFRNILRIKSGANFLIDLAKLSSTSISLACIVPLRVRIRVGISCAACVELSLESLVVFFIAERFHTDFCDGARRVHEFSVDPGVLRRLFISQSSARISSHCFRLICMRADLDRLLCQLVSNRRLLDLGGACTLFARVFFIKV